MDKILIRDGKIALRGSEFANDETDAEWVELRAAWPRLGDEKWYKAARAMELHNFRNQHRYCGLCGSKMEKSTEISLKCTACGHEIWPQLSPAMVVLVTRDGGKEALLVHAANFRNPEVYALVAGFVETGESLEQCVAREIREETSLEVENIRFVGSQSWPFPGQLMTGFTAEYKSGTLKLADGELSAGGWFTRENHPPLPSLPSLSRQIIDRWLENNLP